MHVAEDIQTLTVDRLTDAWIKASIRPNPEYQRGSTWNTRQQQLLIDSLLRGYPLPRFYFEQKRSTDPLGNPQVSLDVIDGQQRLIALSQFRQDKWAIFDVGDRRVPLPEAVKRQPAPWSGKTFSALPEALQVRFLQTELPVVMIDTAETEEVRDLFIRLQAGTPLTPQQVRDAWPGNVGPYIERLAGRGTRQGQYQELFASIDRRGQGLRGEEEYVDIALEARQSCAQLLLLLLAMERGTGFTSLTNTALNNLYHGNTDFDASGETAHFFEALLQDTQAVVTRRRNSSGKKAIPRKRIFSLFLFLRLLHRSPVSVGHVIDELARNFWSMAGEDDEPIGKVGSAATLERHFVWFTDERLADFRPPQLDRRRFFDLEQKQELLRRYDNRCGVCDEPLALGAEEYDHIKPWILGGPTDIDNGRPVHPHCHARGRSALGGLSAPA